MNRVKNLINQLVDLLECVKCGSVFEDCRRTTCGHRFCGDCLEDHIKAKPKNIRAARCPICQRNIYKQGLKDDEFVQEIADIVVNLKEALGEVCSSSSSSSSSSASSSSASSKAASSPEPPGNGQFHVVSSRTNRGSRRSNSQVVPTTPLSAMKATPGERISTARSSVGKRLGNMTTDSVHSARRRLFQVSKLGIDSPQLSSPSSVDEKDEPSMYRPLTRGNQNKSLLNKSGVSSQTSLRPEKSVEKLDRGPRSHLDSLEKMESPLLSPPTPPFQDDDRPAEKQASVEEGRLASQSSDDTTIREGEPIDNLFTYWPYEQRLSTTSIRDNASFSTSTPAVQNSSIPFVPIMSPFPEITPSRSGEADDELSTMEKTVTLKLSSRGEIATQTSATKEKRQSRDMSTQTEGAGAGDLVLMDLRRISEDFTNNLIKSSDASVKMCELIRRITTGDSFRGSSA